MTQAWYNVTGLVCEHLRKNNVVFNVYEYKPNGTYTSVNTPEPYKPYWIRVERDHEIYIEEAYMVPTGDVVNHTPLPTQSTPLPRQDDTPYTDIKEKVENKTYIEEEFDKGPFAANEYTANGITFKLDSDHTWDGGLRTYYNIAGINNTEANHGWGVNPYADRDSIAMHVTTDKPIQFKMCTLQCDGCYRINLPSENGMLQGYLKPEYRHELFKNITVRLDGTETPMTLLRMERNLEDESIGWVPVTDNTYQKEFCTKLICDTDVEAQEIEITIEFHDIISELQKIEHMYMYDMGDVDESERITEQIGHFIDTYYEYDEMELGDLKEFHIMGVSVRFDNLVYQ